MSRRREVAKREILPDPRFGSITLSKFINRVMLDGKKVVAEHIVYEALNLAQERIKTQNIKPQTENDSDENQATSLQDAVSILEVALDNVRPVVEVRSRRVGGATYQVPVEVRAERRDTLAMRWIIGSARSRSEKGMVHKLAHEIVDAIAGRGAAVKKREDVHKMAKANQAFAHFRWA